MKKNLKRSLLLALVLAGSFAFGMLGVGVEPAEAACKLYCCRQADGTLKGVECCTQSCPIPYCGPY